MFSKDTANMIEKLRLRTKTNITSATRGLVPYVQDITDYDIPYDINPLYLYNNNRIVDRERTIIKGNIISYKRYTVNHKTDNIFRMGLMEAISRDLVYPILIFINGEFIKWSEITVVKDYKYNTILLDNKKKYNRESIDRIQVITLPFNVKYTENKKKFKNWTMLFRFDNNGRLNEVGDIAIYAKHPNLVYKPLVFWTPEVYNYDTGIPSNIVMDKVNIIPFKNGLLHTDMNYNINNMNILSITEEGEITSVIECKLFYRTEVPHAIDHITNIPNQKSLRKQIKEGTLDPDVNMSIIKDRFDFQYDTLMKYDDNITNAMEYISLYNSNLLNSEYLNKTKVFTKRITGKEIKTMLNPFGYLTMIRVKYGVRDTYVMVFKNGELYDQYSEIKYTLNYFTLPIGDCDDKDEFEFVYFLDVNNFYLHNSVLQPGNAAISEYPIEEENLLVYSNDPNCIINENPNFTNSPHTINTTNRSRYDVPFHIDNGQIILDDSYYYNKPVDLVSKHQFKYCFRNAVIEMCDIRLTPDFIGCLDPNRYLVFVNGRLLHRRFYKILIEKKDNSFLEPWVYTKKYLHKGDKIEVFYLPYDFNYTKYANNVKVEIASLTSEGDKRTFVIPFPFTNYANDPENTFSVFYGSTFISPQRYTVKNNSITFDFDILAGRKVSFVFIYSKSEEVSDIKYLKENSHIITETAYSVATEENQKKFFIPVPFMGYIDAGNYFFITYRGLFLNKDRFTIHYDNVTTQYYVILDDDIHITKDSAIVFVFTYTIDNNVAMENYILEATENNQTEFKIDKDKFQYMLEGIAGYYLILNGTYVSEELYKLNPNTGSISLTNPLNKGERLSLTVLYSATTYVKDVYVQLEATENNQTVFNLPSVFLKYKKKDNKFLVIIGSVLEDPRSYKIEGNKLILTDGVAKGNNVGLLILYVDKSKKSIMNSISSNKYFRQESIPVQIEEEGQYTFKIPYEYTFKRNYLTFFITIGSVMLDDSRYEVDMLEGTVTILNPDDQVLISRYRQVEFTFVYSDMIVLEKDVRYITINSTNDLYFNLPFENFLTLGNKMLVFIGSTFVEPDRYTITGDYKTERRIHFEEDLKEDDFGRNIMIIYYYATNEDNISLLTDDVSITKLPSSGYIYLSKDDINYAMNKDLYFLFVNGKKVAKKDIIDISANIIRVEKDPQSLYNVQILDYTPKIDEIHQYFEGQFSDYDSQMNLLKANTLDMLFGVYSFMSDTEPMVAPDISESNIIRQINKDFYVVNGNTFNDTFPYNFETETVREFNMLKDKRYHMYTDYRGNLLIDSNDGDVYEIVDGPKSMDKEYNE